MDLRAKNILNLVGQAMNEVEARKLVGALTLLIKMIEEKVDERESLNLRIILPSKKEGKIITEEREIKTKSELLEYLNNILKVLFLESTFTEVPLLDGFAITYKNLVIHTILSVMAYFGWDRVDFEVLGFGGEKNEEEKRRSYK